MRREHEKHLPYFHLLDGIKRADGCPLCGLELESIRRQLDALLYEGVNDPGLRQQLSRSRGYCARHAEALLDFQNGLGTAILYRDQVRIFLRLLDGLTDAPARAASKDVSRYTHHTECPLCRYQRDLRQHYVATLAEGLGHEEMREAFRRSPGLCALHVLLALEDVEDEATRDFLLETERQKFRELLHDLEEFCRKHDYRYTHEGYGKEADSWARAVRMVAPAQDMPRPGKA